jgi:hypothetical protein
MIAFFLNHAAHENMAFAFAGGRFKCRDKGAIKSFAVIPVTIKSEKATGPDLRQEYQVTFRGPVDQIESMVDIFFFEPVYHCQLDACHSHRFKWNVGMLEYWNIR